MTESWFKKQLKTAIVIFFVTNIIGFTCTGFIFYGSAKTKIEVQDNSIKEIKEEVRNKASIPIVIQVKNDLNDQIRELKDDTREIKSDIKELLKRK